MNETRIPLSSVLRNVEDANGLPNEHYTCEQVFSAEKQAVLFDRWAGIGFVSDVPLPGDAKPISLMGVPLILLRDHQGDIKVYQNTCRHRGMVLLQEPTHIKKVLRCPYHSWCYELDGTLQATPHVGGAGCNSHEAIKRDELALYGIRTAVYLGVVFVNISGTAPAFEHYNEQLNDRWSEFSNIALYGDPESTFDLDVKTNWKLAVENYCESYHLPWIHPGLNSYSRLQDHYHIEQRGAFSGQGSTVYRQLSGEDGQVFEDLGSLSSQWDTGAEYIALYPNVLLGVHRDHSVAIILEPVGVDQTIEHVGFFYTEHCATSEEFKALREKNKILWKGVFEEDIGVVEGMQKGRHGPMFDGGKFSPAMDGPTHTFHHWVASGLSAHP